MQKISCPKCGKQSSWQDNPYRPFCSERCQQVDLGRWANEDYSIVGNPVPSDDEQSGL